MSYRNNNSRRERSRESSPIYNRPPHDDYRSKPRDVISPSEFQRRIDPGVPKSKHSVQIKGLPANVRSYEVEDFLQKRVGGPLKTIYFKPDIKNDETVIAIRFEDKEKAPYPISGPLHSNTRPPSNLPPPGFSSILPISKDHLPSTNSSKFSSTNFPNMKSNTTPEPKLNDQTWRTPDPDTFSAARLNTVQTLKYQQPQEKKNDIKGLFRLGTVSVEATKNEMRKEKLYRLTPHARTKVEEKKRELLKAYEDDCKTYGFLTQSLINKNSNLEESLRVALAEVLKDLEEGYKKTLDDFIDIFLSE